MVPGGQQRWAFWPVELSPGVGDRGVEADPDGDREAGEAAYGWEWPLTDDEILARLFKLNQERAGRQVRQR